MPIMPCHLNVGITVKIQVPSCSDSFTNFIWQHLKVKFKFLLNARNLKVAQSQILNLKEQDKSTTKTKVLYSNISLN